MPCTIKSVPRLAYPNPSVRKSYDFRATTTLGNCAMYTEISKISVHSRHACRKDSTSKPPVRVSKNFSRFNDARLQAVSSRNMYSEHGLLALIGPSAGHVCHSLMVVLNCTPGSAHDQAA